MAGQLSNAAGNVAAIALKLGSDAADAMSFVADLGEEMPFMSPVLKTLTAIREKAETVKYNREELKALGERCTYFTASVVVNFKENRSSQIDVAPLEDCMKDVRGVVDRCSRRGRFSKIVKASSDKDDITQLNARIDRLAGDLGLASNAILERKVDELSEKLESMGNERQNLSDNLRVSPTKLAKVSRGTPVRKSWHVERHGVTDAVLKALTSDDARRLVGLVGDSGSGKTTVASEIVRRSEVRETFSDGIVWLSVNEGANMRLSALMLELANMVYEVVCGEVGRRPLASEDGVAYIKQRMAAGEGSKCLVVADNVWEQEVVSKLLETGMWVLLSTRDEQLVAGADGESVGVEELSVADAESVLRKAAELPPEVRLPDDAVNLIGLCGRVVMDLAFVGRWSTVRGRQDPKAWAGATEKVRTEMSEVGCDPGNQTAEDTRIRRRKAVLRAGFEDLAIGSDDERVQRLYLSLAVMPDGHAFSLKDATILLYDGVPSPEDEASVAVVVGILERWSILRSTGRTYRMHDAHSSFARESLLDRGHVRRPALARWVKNISSLDALRSVDQYALKGLWLAVERVGGDSWDTVRPYVKALAEMDESDPLLRQSIEAVGWFQEAQEDWKGASTTARWLLEVEKRELGADHPFVLNSFQHLAECADRLGQADEAAKWREKEREQLPLALGRMQLQVDSIGFDQEDLTGVCSLHSKRWMLEPDDRAATEKLLRCCLTVCEPKLGPEDVTVAHVLFQRGMCVREAGRLEEAEELLRRCLAIREAKLGPEDVQVCIALYELGVCVREAGRLDEAEELLRRCLAIREAKLGPGDLQLAFTLHELGLCVRSAGRLEEAEVLLRRCLAIKEAKLGPEDVQVAYTLAQLGVCVRKTGRLEEAGELLRRCSAIRGAKLSPGDLQLAFTLYQLGRCVREAGQLEDAEVLLRRCLVIEEAKLGTEDVQVAFTLHQLGACVREAGRLEEGEVLLRRCLAIMEAKLGLDGVQVSCTLYELGLCLQEERRLDEAEVLFRRCLSIEEAKYGPQNVQVASVLHRMGVCVLDAGRFAEAEKLLRRCLAIEEAQFGPEDVRRVAYTRDELGVCVREAGRLEEAVWLLERCLSAKEAKLGPNDLQVAHTLSHLYICARRSGRLEEAEVLMRRCLSIEEDKLGPDDVRVAYTLYQLGTCALEAGRLEEAEALLRRSVAINEARLGPDDVRVAVTLSKLYVCVRRVGRLEEAEKLVRRCLSIEEVELGPEDVQVAYTLRELGVCVLEARGMEEAEKLLRRSLSIKEAKLGQQDVEVAYTLLSLGVCLQRAGLVDNAEDCLRRSLGIRETKLGPEDRRVADALHHLGVCLRVSGRLGEAEDLFKRCLTIQEATRSVGQTTCNIPADCTLRELDLCVREAGVEDSLTT